MYACAVISKCYAVNRSTAQDPRGEEILTTRDRSCLDFAERRSSPGSSLGQDESGGEEVLTPTRTTMPGLATATDARESAGPASRSATRALYEMEPSVSEVEIVPSVREGEMDAAVYTDPSGADSL